MTNAEKSQEYIQNLVYLVKALSKRQAPLSSGNLEIQAAFRAGTRT